MLIVSKFRDYYDSVLSYGVDKSVVYNRKSEILQLSEKIWKDAPSYETKGEVRLSGPRGREHHSYEINQYLIGFCGKIYPVSRVDWDQLSTHYPASREYFYDAEEYIGYLKQQKIPLEKHYRIWHRSKPYDHRTEQGIRGFFEFDWSKYTSLFQEHKCPTFVVGRQLQSEWPRAKINLELNPCLKDHKFGRVKDSVTAFQQIYMFISGVLGTPERPMVELNDKELAAKKGHGGKYSFRKPPGGGRWR